MRAQIKASLLALSLLCAGVLVSPSAQVSIQRGWQATSSAITAYIDGIGTTSADGFSAVNRTSAAAGAQQYSPMVCQEGQGWKTTATAGSQSVEFCWEVQPVQGTTAPSGNYLLKASINGGAFSTVGTFTSGGQILQPDGSISAPAFSFAGDPDTGMYVVGSGGDLRMTVGGFDLMRLVSGHATLNASSELRWGSTGVASSDLALSRSASGKLRVGSASNANTYDITLADWGTTQSAEAVSVANAGLLYLGDQRIGTVNIVLTEDGGSSVFRIGPGATTLISGGATVSVTKDNAGTANLYYDAAGPSGAGHYFQNNRGATRSVRLVLIGV